MKSTRLSLYLCVCSINLLLAAGVQAQQRREAEPVDDAEEDTSGESPATWAPSIGRVPGGAGE